VVFDHLQRFELADHLSMLRRADPGALDRRIGADGNQLDRIDPVLC